MFPISILAVQQANFLMALLLNRCGEGQRSSLAVCHSNFITVQSYEVMKPLGNGALVHLSFQHNVRIF